MDDCLRLLKGERDEQKFAGLLLATKLCQGDDEASVRNIYDAVGFRFLSRLLRTGLGKGGEERGDYMKLAVTVMATFCRVPVIASSADVLSLVPLFLEILKNTPQSSLVEECYECLMLIGNSSPDGLKLLLDSGAIKVLSSQMPSLADGSQALELSMHLLLTILNKLPVDMIIRQNADDLASTVVTVSRHFALLHNALKFEALHILSTVLSFHHVEPLYQSLKSRCSDYNWGSYIGIGVIAILQNRVAIAEKLEVLVLAEAMMNIYDESWLISTNYLPDVAEAFPVDRCLLLVLESSRVEVAVLLNELAYLKYEVSKDSAASSSQTLLTKQRNLGTAYSLIEKIIKLISGLFESEGSAISEGTLTKAMSGITETVDLVFDFLQDAKEHGNRKGDDLLASARIIGSYLAETPFAFNQRVAQLLDFMLLVEGEAEDSSFYSICFLLPMLSQTTTEAKACKLLLSRGGHKLVIKFVLNFVKLNSQLAEDNIGTLYFACEIILNILTKVDDIQVPLDVLDFLPLLQACADLAGGVNRDSSTIMMYSCICTLVLDLTSEGSLLGEHDIDQSIYSSVSQLIVLSLGISRQGKAWGVLESEHDLCKIVTEGYCSLANRFPRIKEAVEGSGCLKHFGK